MRDLKENFKVLDKVLKALAKKGVTENDFYTISIDSAVRLQGRFKAELVTNSVMALAVHLKVENAQPVVKESGYVEIDTMVDGARVNIVLT